MSYTSRLLTLASLVVFLGGCQGSTIIEAFNFEKDSLLTDAKVRTIVSRTVDGRRIICAEPSPDALVAIARAASAQAQIAGKGGGGIAFSLSEHAASIGIRTATIQLLRDGLYRACEAYANGAVDKFGYALILNKIDDVMVTLLGIEGLTRIPPAVQVTIGTKSRSSFEGAQENKKKDGDNPVTSENKGEGKSSAEAIKAAFKALTVTKHDATAMTALSSAITNLAQKDNPGSTVAGACMMWLSSYPDFNDSKPRDKAMFKLCGGAFKTANFHSKFLLLKSASPTTACMAWLISTSPKERKESKDITDGCQTLLVKAAEAEAKAKVEAKAKADAEAKKKAKPKAKK